MYFSWAIAAAAACAAWTGHYVVAAVLIVAFAIVATKALDDA